MSQILFGLFGLCVLLGIAWLFSNAKSKAVTAAAPSGCATST